MRRPLVFKKTDVTRAIKAVIAAGMAPGRVELAKDGKIVVIADSGADQDSGSDLDKWMKSRARKS
jgi:hypothetical protein